MFRWFVGAVFLVLSGPYASADYMEGDVWNASDRLCWDDCKRLVSGPQSQTLADFRPPEDGMAMIGLAMAERGDDPCDFDILYDDVTDAKVNPVVHGSMKKCNHAGGQKRVGNDRSRTSIKMNDGFLINGISVCTNRQQTKVKGVRFEAIHKSCLGWDGVQQRSRVNSPCPGGGRVERRNCDFWYDYVRCPDGMVAIGLQYSTTRTNKRTFAKGLGLKCARYVYQD